MQERRTSRAKISGKKTDPSKRSLPVIYQELDPEARRMKAAGDAVLADAKGAQKLVDLGEFLCEHFDMSKLVKIKKLELTPRRRAATELYRGAQLLKTALNIAEKAQKGRSRRDPGDTSREFPRATERYNSVSVRASPEVIYA